MKNILVFIFLGCINMTVAQTNMSLIDQVGVDQIVNVNQQVTENQDTPQSAWVYQSGEMEDHTTGIITAGGELNLATVNQTGGGNKSLLYQFGSNNTSTQQQNGINNEFNMAEVEVEEFSVMHSEPDPGEGPVPNQDGDFHKLTQIAEGNYIKAWSYQAGRMHTASQDITGNYNEVWTSQSGNTHYSQITVNGTGNGSIYLVHEEGKFPHSEEDDHEDGGGPGGHGNGGSSGGHGEGGMPDEIPPTHDDDHEFVPTVSIAVKQMGRNSRAYMNITGDYNKALITQRGGSGGSDQGVSALSEECRNPETGGGHEVHQTIFGDYNRIFAGQNGTSHYLSEDISGNYNLAVLMQKGKNGRSYLELTGNYNEVGVDQKGNGNYSDIEIDGDWNGNFNPDDEYGIMVAQEGRGNWSEIDVLGDSNYIFVHQSGGGISTINQTGDFNSATVNQSTLDTH